MAVFSRCTKATNSSIMLITAATLALAGGPKQMSGDASVVKSEKKFNVEMVWNDDFEYDGDPFKDYYKEQIDEMTKEGKTADLETFKTEWKEWKAESYPDGFAQGFNSELEEKFGITATRGNNNAKYTFLIKTLTLEPGGMSTAVVEVEVSIVETANRDKIIAVIGDLESRGRLPGPEKVRVQDAYRMVGEDFGEDFFIKKVLKK